MPGYDSRTATAPANYLSKGLQGEFANTYDLIREEETWLGELFMDISVDGRNAVEQGWYDVPLPGNWLRGESPDEGDFSEFTKEYIVYDHKTPWLTWHVDDEQDDRSPKKFTSRVQDSAELLSRYDEYALTELLAGSGSTYLNPLQNYTSITGSSLFNDSHSYGPSGSLDNITTGSGVATVQEIVKDWYAVLNGFRGMTNSQGDPYWGTQKIDSAHFFILCSPAIEQVMDAAWKSTNVVMSGGSLTAETNYLPMRDKSKVVVWNRLSGNDWFVFLANQDHCKPFVRAKRKAAEVREWNEENSDWSRANNKRGLMWWSRLLYGMYSPFCAYKVDN